MEENIFNAEVIETDGSLFLQGKRGLFDTINKPNPELWELYKKLKSLDWDELEFDFSSCASDFLTCPADVRDIMIKTLAWQWEADSIACHNLIPIVAPFVSSTELWAFWVKVNENENLHAATYSEIVRFSFDHPDEVMTSILKEVKSLQRLSTVMRVFANVYETSHKLALGLISPDSDEAYDAIFIFTVMNLTLERIQFMASFAITFAIADSGWFIPIGQAVQKINVEELQIHVKGNKAVLTNELRYARGQEALIRNMKLIKAILKEVTDCELAWNCDYLLADGKELAGVTASSIEKWILFSANDVYTFFQIENPYEVVNKNPLGFITEWIDISSVQVSPQEARGGNYLLGGIVDNLGDKILPIDF